MSDEMMRAVDKVRGAIRNEGPQPQYHAQTMARHRKEWPTLWKALDELLAARPPAAPQEKPE